MPDDPLNSFKAFNAAAAKSPPKIPDDPVLPCPLSRTVRLRIVAKDQQFAVIKDARYELQVQGETFSGNTGATGVVDHEVPAAYKTGRLTLWPSGSGEPIVYDFVIEAYDPIELETGITARLKNLGYFDKDTALDDFQRALAVEPSTEMDSATLERLKEAASERDQPLEPVEWLPPGTLKELSDLYKGK